MRSYLLAAFVAVFALAPLTYAASATKPSTKPASQPAATQPVELPGFKTVETAITATIKPAISSATAQPGFLGISLGDSGSKVVVDSVAAHSPASEAGILAGDQIVRINQADITHRSSAAETLLGLTAGDTVKIAVRRDDKERTFAAPLVAVSKPLKMSAVRAVMGVQLRDVPDSDGAMIASVTKDFPAEKAGLKAGDVILRIDELAVGATTSINELLASYSPDEVIKVRYRHDGELKDVKVKLAADERSGLENRAFDNSRVFRKEVFRLGIIGIEYSDNKHNDKIKPEDWEKALFSSGEYTEKNATGQQVFGSMNDYYREVSCGKVRIEGKMFPWVELAKNRSEYGQGSGDTRMLNEAIDKLQARDGKNVLKDYDGLVFLYGGGRLQTNRGNIFWPHKGYMIHGGKRWPFFICPEGSDRMANISVFTHEFGHMLGLPDLYARPENPGSEGLGQWCLMSNQIGNGKPQHMSAWCKEQLGWITPTVIDPAVKQKLVLSPIEGTTNQCFKVLARADGSEYFLLEARKKNGFDIDLPGEGLLIWRVVRNRPMLEESHGVEGPLGPRSFLRSVPFPSISNHAFTPYTTPSSRPQLGGGTPVFITEIERLPDGRVTFSIGYEMY
jgi:M6 family metalloprotease-like protein